VGVSHTRRPRRIVAGIAIFGLAAAVFVSRQAMLRSAGRILVADDPLHPADAIVLAVDAGDAGVLEAADLVRSGISRRVGLFADPPGEGELEFRRRGIPYESQTDRATRQLRAMGIEQIERIPGTVDGTADEGRTFPGWCEGYQLRSVIVVTNSDHSRRLRRTLHRAMKGRSTVVLVRPARHSEFDPDNWWRKRGGIRTEIVELEKLMLDVLLHPLS
jgi:hypothetical protein